MKANENPIRRAMGTALQRAGYEKKGSCWYRDNEEVLEVANLQKSQYAQKFYINYAIWIKQLGKHSFPQPHLCHVKLRAEPIVQGTSHVAPLFNLEINMPDREAALREFFANDFLPLAESCRTLAGLRAMFNAGRLSGLILAAARSLLEPKQS